MDLVTQWKNITWDVINLQNISILKLQVLSIETYELLDLYKDKNYTRKQFAALLLEMQEFSWWVGTLPDSPVHDNYQQVYTLIQTLIKHYLDEPIDRQQIETLIDAIELEVIYWAISLKNFITVILIPRHEVLEKTKLFKNRWKC